MTKARIQELVSGILKFSLISCLLVGCHSTKINSISKASDEKMLRHKYAISKTNISANRLLADVAPDSVYTVLPKFRKLHVVGAINLTSAPGVRDSDLEARNVTELAVPFAIAPTPFVEHVCSYSVFVRKDRVIAIGFGGDSLTQFIELVGQNR